MPNLVGAMHSSLPLILIFALSGCVTPIETRVDSKGEKGGQVAAYQLGVAMASADGLLAQNSVTSNLANRGIKPSDVATVRLDVTFYALPAELKLMHGEGDSVFPKKVHIPKSSKQCEPTDYRLGVRFTDIRSGVIVYRASAAEYHCKAAAEPIIASLTKAVLADIGDPKGLYVLTQAVDR